MPGPLPTVGVVERKQGRAIGGAIDCERKGPCQHRCGLLPEPRELFGEVGDVAALLGDKRALHLHHAAQLLNGAVLVWLGEDGDVEQDAARGDPRAAWRAQV